MTQWSRFFVIVMVILLCTPKLHAQTPPTAPETPAATAAPAPVTQPEVTTDTPGFFFNAGFITGYEVDFFKTPNFGITTAIGYQTRLLPKLGLYLRSDVFALSKDGVFHLDVTALPSVRYVVFNHVYGFGGIGYNYIHAAENSTLTGTPSLIRRAFHSVTAEGGAGYTYFLKKNFGLGGEAGLNYVYLEKSDFPRRHLWRPFLRVNASWKF